MKPIQSNSPELDRVLKNMHLENLYLSPSLQQKALDIVNSDQIITRDLIKEALADDKIQ